MQYSVWLWRSQVPRDPRAEKFVRLRRERRTRAVGRFYSTPATAYGDACDVRGARGSVAWGAPGSPRCSWLVWPACCATSWARRRFVPWLHLVLHAMGLSHGGTLLARLR